MLIIDMEVEVKVEVKSCLSVLLVVFGDVEVEVGRRGCWGDQGCRRSSGSLTLIIDVGVEMEVGSRLSVSSTFIGIVGVVY